MKKRPASRTSHTPMMVILAIYNGGIIPSIPLNHQYDIFDVG